jgi:hypothetical protein
VAKGPLETATATLERFAKTPAASRPQQLMIEKVLDALPEGVPAEPLIAVLTERVRGALNLSDLTRIPAWAFPQAVAALQRLPRQPNVAFVLAALPMMGNDRKALEELVRVVYSLDWAGRAKREPLVQWAKNPALVAGAQAAVALDPFDYVTSRFMPLLAAEGSEASIDGLMPFIQRAVKEQGSQLDWLKDQLAPLFADTQACRDVRAMLEAKTAERTARSPALDFAKQLGIDPPPPVLQFNARFAGPGGFSIRVDSTKARWFSWRRAGFSVWGEIEPLQQLKKQASPGRTAFRLQLKTRGVDRTRLEAWLQTLFD